jgi:hypothetical protein
MFLLLLETLTRVVSERFRLMRAGLTTELIGVGRLMMLNPFYCEGCVLYVRDDIISA